MGSLLVLARQDVLDVSDLARFVSLDLLLRHEQVLDADRLNMSALVIRLSRGLRWVKVGKIGRMFMDEAFQLVRDFMNRRIVQGDALCVQYVTCDLGETFFALLVDR
jgi:hypothetical protein